MKSFIVALILTAFLYTPTWAQPNPCQTGNPCQLDNYFTTENGYQCIQKDSAAVLCTCPGGFEVNQPCRLCSRTDPGQNVCHNANGRLLACLETNEYGTSYACLCSDGFGGNILTTDADCDTSPGVTLTTSTMTTTPTPHPSSLCLNGGVFVDGICHCPSGYSGTLCTDKNHINLCDRVKCKNNGTCVIRNNEGLYAGVCRCRNGTSGEYCELSGTSGYCSADLCLNGVCKENVVGSARHAYCRCSAGYDGPKCENRYFACPEVGRYPDLTMFNQGKYFECTNVNGAIRVQQRSCPRGLRFNANRDICTY